MAITYYHLTSSKNLQDIMQNGLLPKIGDNSKAIGEKKPRIYLCDKKSIPYWKILLGNEVDTVLEINDPYIRKELGAMFSRYDEWIKMSPIKPKYIKIVKNPKIATKRAVHELQIDYIYSISKLCERCARYYTPLSPLYHDNEYHEIIKYELMAINTIIPRLHYEGGIQKWSTKQTLLSEGESGMFTMVDWYDVNPDEEPTKRLWEMLCEYPMDDLYNHRKQLYESIKAIYPTDILTLNTGGFTL